MKESEVPQKCAVCGSPIHWSKPQQMVIGKIVCSSKCVAIALEAARKEVQEHLRVMDEEFMGKVRDRTITTHELAEWLLGRQSQPLSLPDGDEDGGNAGERWSTPIDLTDIPYSWPDDTDAIQVGIRDNGHYTS